MTNIQFLGCYHTLKLLLILQLLQRIENNIIQCTLSLKYSMIRFLYKLNRFMEYGMLMRIRIQLNGIRINKYQT
nr:MAG TPA: hypothetical protein [Caudoviricetes sp.]